MKKFVAVLMMIVLVATLSMTVFADCPNPDCYSGKKEAYCGGGQTITGLNHTFIYYDPFWPFGETEGSCTYALTVDHTTYGICSICGTYYPPGSDVFFNHEGECAHSHEKCDGSKVPVCSSGDWLEWYSKLMRLRG